jgi:ATP-dependent helicase HrpA
MDTSKTQDLQQEIAALMQRIPYCLYKDRERLSARLHSLAKRQRERRDITKALLKLMEQVESSAAAHEFRLNNVPQLIYPKPYPILDKKQEIIEAIRKHRVLIIAGETGSGKTTQLPKFCLEAGRGREGKIGITQPRRVAATSVTRYLETQVHGKNKPVSYKIRFHSTDSDHAYIKMMTDGILLAETQTDPNLYEYDTLIIDEAHERSLNIDFILGYLKRLLPQRPDLNIIVSSATMDTKAFSEFFDNAPIIEVSGRTYPVTVLYDPIDRKLEELGELTMIDKAIKVVKDVLDTSLCGDILIFMPTEADIRETIDRLRGYKAKDFVVLPLFSRLTVDEQNQIFAETPQRKIIVATNIAETSITIPGIRFCIDSGYARISRYCPRSKTRRLPIENISQSSAEQRKGRCGRVEEGICVRLYAEEELATREQFTAPEIKRADLAEVILRMLALSLGDIENFSFVDAPTKTAIRDGLNTLRELGAVSDDNRLTEMGRAMSQIPTDPRTSRILLAANEEKALKEVLIIAAVLSIQDPRERPYEKQGEADEKHRQFANCESDFLSYLNLWNTYHETLRKLKTQGKIRKFCRENFLSFPRMREWSDLHEELTNNLTEHHLFKLNSTPPSYEAIHKAVLSGFLGNIGQQKEKNIYSGRGGTQFMIFPGSGQFDRNFDWIVASELVETSRLFARNVARIDVEWVEPLARDLCHYSYQEPHFDVKSGQVVAFEKVTLWGMTVIARRRIHYGRINRQGARDIFIHEGFVAGDIGAPFKFLTANQRLIASVVAMENKIRKRTLLADEGTLGAFYLKNLPDVVNVQELKEFLATQGSLENKLTMSLSDVLQEGAPQVSAEDFPDYLLLGSQKISLTYRFTPDAPDDGVTLNIPENILPQLSPEPFEWLIPGMLADKLTALLKSLSKDLRKQLVPLPDKVADIVARMPRTHGALLSELEQFLRKEYSLKIVREDWQLDEVPASFFMRFAVLSHHGNVIASSRNLRELQAKVQSDRVDILWEKAHKKWFLPNLRNWCFSDLPEKIEVSPHCGGIPHLGYPGLELVNGQVNRTLFTSLIEATEETRCATELLLEFSLRQEIQVLERALAFPKELEKNYVSKGWARNLREESYLCLKESLLSLGGELIRKEELFAQKRGEIQEKMFSIVPQWIKLLAAIWEQYQVVENEAARPAFRNGQKSLAQTWQEARSHLQELFPARFLATMRLSSLEHYPRYLKGIALRLNRAVVDPLRDRKKWEDILPHITHLHEARQLLSLQRDAVSRQMLDEYRWLLEELKISVFAQELKTACPVSGKRLLQRWEELTARAKEVKSMTPPTRGEAWKQF